VKYLQTNMKYTLLLLLIVANVFAKGQIYFPPNTGNTWATITPAELGWCEDQIPELLTFLESNNTKAFIVLKNGKIVIENYFGTFTQDSLWYWASAGKTLTSYLVGIAQQNGQLSINDLSSSYLGSGWTSCTAAQENNITVRNQLTMTSGLDDGIADPYCTDPNCLVYSADAGTRWAYHNGPYTLLDGVLEGATGQTLNGLVFSALKQPTGMDGFFFQSGYNNVYLSTARSMARFGILMQNGGNWNGNQLMTDANYYQEMISPSQNLNNSYGYLWWLNGQSSYMIPQAQIVIPGMMFPNAPSDVYAAIGRDGQFLNVSPSEGLVFIRMGNAPDNSLVPFLLNDQIWEKLNYVMCTPVAEESDENFWLNQTATSVRINWPGKVFECEILGADGKRIATFSSKETADVSTSLWAQGVYFVKCSNGHEIVVKKVFVR
jgi:CubicO group peptidase (beta-lactamase class C family)